MVRPPRVAGANGRQNVQKNKYFKLQNLISCAQKRL